jgi:hypothetical protein
MILTFFSTAALITLSQLASASDSANQAKVTGFEIGSVITTNELDGTVMVSCNDPRLGTQSGYFDCRAENFSPDLQSRFQTATPVDADRVMLVAKHSNGKSVKKSSGFDGAKGLSTSSFNLLISTLLQTPLLDDGNNQVSYLLTKSGNTVASGTFAEAVKSGPAMTCENMTVFSNDMNDCTNPTYACDLYWNREPNCY